MYYIMDIVSYPKFIRIAKDNKSVVATEETDPARYEWKISQFKSVIYIANHQKSLIKIIMLAEDFDKEVRLQQIAAEYNLAPEIILSSPKQIPDTTLFGSPYYFIEMEYLNPHVWGQIGAVGEDVDEYNDVLCRFIRELVEKTNIYNVEDPQLHFYFNVETSEIKMIDFDRCKQCLDEEKEYFINAMYEQIPGLNCNIVSRSVGGGKLARARKNKSRRKNKSKGRKKTKSKSRRKNKKQKPTQKPP